ncbi:MAG: hypothetical protein M9962_02535 [Oligoflexia bacterium]|nr:hypothetical protein [Oligoflexia bacterium]
MKSFNGRIHREENHPLPKTEILLSAGQILLLSQRVGDSTSFYSHRTIERLHSEWVHLLEEHSYFHRSTPSDLRWTLAFVKSSIYEIESGIHQSGGKILATYKRERDAKLSIDPIAGELKFLDPALSAVVTVKNKS